MPKPAYQKKESCVRGGFYAGNSARHREALTLVLQTGLAGIHYYLDPERNPEDRKLLDSLKPGTGLLFS